MMSVQTLRLFWLKNFEQAKARILAIMLSGLVLSFSVVGSALAGAEPDVDSSYAHESETQVNLNRASLEELMTLSGIGEAKAQAILNDREEHGNFNSIEELERVKGIGKALVEKNRSRLSVVL